jgi:inhibitor of KinA
MKWNSFPIGEGCWSWRLGDSPDPALSRKLLAVYRDVKASPPLGMLDVVPAYTELAVYFDPLKTEVQSLREAVEKKFEELDSTELLPENVIRHTLPVVYDGEDLEGVAEHTGLAVEAVIRLHSAPDYSVAMIGFLPHFPYCLGLDSALTTPRRSSPRVRVPAGSVAIAGEQTGVYPRESPGGWNLIGRTLPELLLEISPGDQLRFEAVEELP